MIYADYNGSAPLHPKVNEYLVKRIPEGPYANPNAIHSMGRKMNFGMEKCRMICAKVLGAQANQVSFNSGASEGIAHIFHSVLSDRKDGKNIIITSGIEHSAVVNACKYYSENRGFKTITLNTLESGVIDFDQYKNLMQEHKGKVALVAIMAANNETGVIQPYREIAQISKEMGSEFFCDTTQYVGKIEFNFEESNIDYAVVSGHKVGAIIGSGILLSKSHHQMKPLIFGGAVQEYGIRGGTQNYIGAETLAVALEAFQSDKKELDRVSKLRVQFEQNMKKKFPELYIVGESSNRLATTTMISNPGIHGQAVQIELESNDIFVTTSSACSDNEPVTSKVLKAMGIDDKVGRGIIRISFCTGTTAEIYNQVEEALTNAYKKLSKIHTY
jgi:cysteine desulfurase